MVVVMVSGAWEGRFGEGEGGGGPFVGWRGAVRVAPWEEKNILNIH